MDTSMIEAGALARVIRDEIEKLGWTYRDAAEKSVAFATEMGWTRRWGEKRNVVGISYSSWQGLATGRGIADLEVIYLAVLTLREHGSTITFWQVFEAMGFVLDGDSGRQARALTIIGSLPKDQQLELEEIATLPPSKYSIVQALVAALKSMKDD